MENVGGTKMGKTGQKPRKPRKITRFPTTIFPLTKPRLELETPIGAVCRRDDPLPGYTLVMVMMTKIAILMFYQTTFN